MVSHSAILIDALHRATAQAGTAVSGIELLKDFGETLVADQGPLDGPTGEGSGIHAPVRGSTRRSGVVCDGTGR